MNTNVTNKVNDPMAAYMEGALHSSITSSAACDWTRFAGDDNKIKGEKQMKTEKFINLWKSKKRARVLDHANQRTEIVLSTDSLYSDIKTRVTAIDEILQSQGYDLLSPRVNFNSYTCNVTDGEIDKIQKEYIQLLKSIDDEYTEICAMLSACDTYEQEMQVLIAYGVVNKDGKMATAQL